jgi:hypothetical protein
VDGESHVVHVEEEAAGSRLTIGSLTVLAAKEADPSRLLAASPGKLVRHLVAAGSHLQQNQPYAEVEVRGLGWGACDDVCAWCRLTVVGVGRCGWGWVCLPGVQGVAGATEAVWDGCLLPRRALVHVVHVGSTSACTCKQHLHTPRSIDWAACPFTTLQNSSGSSLPLPSRPSNLAPLPPPPPGHEDDDAAAGPRLWHHHL